MISDLKESFNSIFNERLNSPFYGALIISWLIWNWKVLYLTFFIDSKELKINKIDYIVANYGNEWDIIYWPLISTFFIILILPFITNGAYYISLLFNSWKVDKRNSIEKKQLLTIEQSIQLREEIANQAKKFGSLLSEKNDEINQLKLQLNEVRDNINNQNNAKNKNRLVDLNKSGSNIQVLASKIIYNEHLKEGHSYLQKIISGPQNDNTINGVENIDPEVLSFYEINGLIKKYDSRYYWTSIGEEVNKIVFNEKF